MVPAAVVGICSAQLLKAEMADAAASPNPAAAAPPKLSSADQTYLIRMIRKTLSAHVAGRGLGRLADPPTLARLRCPVYVTLRRGGYAMMIAQADGRENLAVSCRTAAGSALKDYQGRDRVTESLLKRLAVEVEILGPAEQLDVGLLSPRRLSRRYRPGMDGAAIRLQDQSALIRPSQIISMGFSTADAIAFLEARLGLTDPTMRQRRGRAICLRFRTCHFWQPRADEPVVELHRGCALVEPEAVNAKHLDRAIDQIARHLQDRQRPDGLFPGAYLPWADRQEQESPPAIIQAGAAWALAQYAAHARKPAATQAAKRIVTALSRQLARLDDAPGGPAVYLKSPEQADRLGATAVLLLAAAEIRPAQTYQSLRSRLTAAILTRQLTTGRLETNFITTRPAAPQQIDPGQALLALAGQYLLDRSPAIESAMAGALDHYQKLFAVKPSEAMVPWLAAAYARMDAATRNGEYADFAFQMIDWLVPHQLTPGNCKHPVLHGGIDATGGELPNVTTGLQMAAVADALALARRLDDHDRAARYEQLLRRGTRFVLQLRFRPEECYYVRSRLDTINGVRGSPWNHTLAVGNSQIALIALIKARRVLFPE